MSADICPTCEAPAHYLAVPRPEGEGTTIPLPQGAFGGRWYHDAAAPSEAIAARDSLIAIQRARIKQLFDECQRLRAELAAVADRKAE